MKRLLLGILVFGLLVGVSFAVPLGQGLGDYFPAKVTVGTTVESNFIAENTPAAGVTVDGVLCKDGGIVATGDIYTVPWTAWTSTIVVSGGTVETYTSVFVSRYRTVGKKLDWQIKWRNVTGGTAGSGTSSIIFTLPVAISANLSPTTFTVGLVIGHGIVYESGGTIKDVSVIAVSATTCNFIYDGTTITGNDQSSDSREITAQGFYEID